MRTGLVTGLLLLAATMAWAEVGDLQPAAVAMGDSAAGSRPYAGASAFTKPADGSGVSSDKAKAAVVKMGATTLCVVAVDSRKSDAEQPDIIRFDFTGQGKFDDQSVLELKREEVSGPDYYARFGPATVQAKIGDATAPVQVEGYYYKMSDQRSLGLTVTRAVQGQCQFGEKTYAVRLVDDTNNLRLNDQAKVTNPRMTSGLTSDVVLLDTGKGDFKDAKTVVKAFYGQPLRVDSQWYTLTVSEDGKKVSAKAVELPTGQVKLSAGNSEAILASRAGLFCIKGAAEPTAIPADTYYVRELALYGPTSPDGKRATIRCSRTGTEPPLVIEAGKTATAALGAPLRARPAVQVAGRQASINLELKDASGLRVTAVELADGRQPAEPNVKIIDGTGKEIYAAKLSYG